MQNTALYQLLEKKLTLFQPKLGNTPNWPKAYFMPHNVILQKTPKKTVGNGTKER